MAKIIFYEDRDFQGRSYAVTADQPDMHAHLNRCNSIQVESGCWMIYERPHYIGHQYFLKRGEYSNYQQWMGFNDSVKSCCIITPVSSLRIRVYERNDVGGRMTESFCDYPSLCDEFHPRDIQSCHVFEGNWIFCGQPNYRARQSLLRPRAYRGVTDWGAGTAWLVTLGRQWLTRLQGQPYRWVTWVIAQGALGGAVIKRLQKGRAHPGGGERG
ncbi:gamma-crystallin C-like [Terrapene carolina triunguis]|uniref:gamma-crystallin C-like n=1 Tax=Terrapene triunguis TaxID=2587831 RepID=UPI000CEFC1E4|nr:gamma-crystallin C-like [Terrapene carolina triunguis]